MMKRILFLFCLIMIFCLALVLAKPVDTELIKAFISPHNVIENYIVKLANISSKKVNVIFYGDTQENVENLKADFPNFQPAPQAIIDVYKNYPTNFISEKRRNFLKNKQYNLVEQDALEKLYNPLGIMVAPLENDPYLFATDFVTNLAQMEQDDVKTYQGKYYSVSHFDIQNNQDLHSIIDYANGKNIYLTGTPIHSYFAAKKSNLEINIICFISTLLLLILCKFYFHSIKIIFPIALSILFGFLLGYSASALIFKNLHILTFVFSTSLIGISLDYSLHYFLTSQEKGFKKSLTTSMLTTVLAFSPLLFSNITILKQIAVFTSFGLIGVYLFVLIVMPMFGSEIQSTGKFKKITFNKKLLAIIPLVILLGVCKLNFDDNIKNLYVPPKNLAIAEETYQKVYNQKVPEFLIVKGNNIDEILQKEEQMQGFGLSNFVASKIRQQENLKLVETFYHKNLNSYENKIGAHFSPQKSEIYDVENFPLNKDFMLDKNTSFIVVDEHQEGSINVANEISKILRKLRIKCLILLPIAILILFGFLAIVYGFKNAIKITLSPLIGILFTVGILSLAGQSLNLFNLIGLFLILGFSLDYSIFRLNGAKKSKDAVFISILSTALSFLLLSFTSFKLISTLGLTLFIGITTSYIASLFMIKSKHD